VSRFTGPQRSGAMKEYRQQRAANALNRQREEKLRDESRRQTSKHSWVPATLDFSCICSIPECKEVWPPDMAHPPKTECPQKARTDREERTKIDA